MSRYFLEVAYKGTQYSGFQVQENARTIQSEVEKAYQTLHRSPVKMTGSSRTDAGVHAYQNFFHFNSDNPVHPQALYKLNAILPPDIVVKNLFLMHDDAHARFDACSRGYAYSIHRSKNPFLRETSFFYPYKLNLSAMQEGAAHLLGKKNFYSFSKTNTQVTNFDCNIIRSEWTEEGENLCYTIEGNRFLRGMVRLITASLLKLGRDKLSLADFESFFRDNTKSGVSVPPHGLFLRSVSYPRNYFPAQAQRFTDF